MAGSMSMADLVTDLKGSLQDAATVFTAANDADFNRHLNVAASAFNRARPRTLLGSVALVADRATYAVPSDLHGFKSSLWGVNPVKSARPWEKAYPGKLPDVAVVEESGARKLCLSPPPSGTQINVLGATFKFYYYARHSIHATDGAQTTIQAGDRNLLILRAQAEAMRELAMRNIKKPAALRDGTGMVTKNGTPAALYEKLLEEFEGAVQ